jgi:hypothetical protein
MVGTAPGKTVLHRKREDHGHQNLQLDVCRGKEREKPEDPKSLDPTELELRIPAAL